MRNAVQEIGGAVERIDDPAVALVGAGVRAAFLAEEAVIRPRLGELFAHRLLGAAVGGGDEIARPLQRHLQMLDLAEIALEPAPGAMRRLDHDVEDRGMDHGHFAACLVTLKSDGVKLCGSATARAPAAPARRTPLRGGRALPLRARGERVG